MKIPNVKRFNNAADLFAKIYEINKQDKSSFSHRVFARKMKWPASYLSDVIKGRKKLTLSRGIQFATIFKLTVIQTEHLISLCLAENEDAGVSQYFKTQLKNKDLTKEKNTSITKEYINSVSDVRSLYLRELIIWGQGRKSISELLKAQKAFPELLDANELKKSLDSLLEKKLIEEVKPLFFKAVKDKKNNLALDDSGEIVFQDPKVIAQSHIRQLEILIRLLQSFDGYGLTFSSFLDFSVDRLPLVRDKMFELRDLLISFTKEEKSEVLSQTKCFQFEMHLLPMFNLDKIN